MDQETLHDAIKTCSVFSDYDDSLINSLILNSRTISYTEGQTIYKKGETASKMFCLIVSGSVNIISEQGEILNTIGPGNIIGEIGTISPQKKRTITVSAAESVDVLEWNLETIYKKSA